MFQDWCQSDCKDVVGKDVVTYLFFSGFSLDEFDFLVREGFQTMAIFKNTCKETCSIGWLIRLGLWMMWVLERASVGVRYWGLSLQPTTTIVYLFVKFQGWMDIFDE